MEEFNKYVKCIDINKEDCFSQNAIMGVRTEGSAMGKRPAYNHPDFLNDCRQFLVNQINIQRPKLF